MGAERPGTDGRWDRGYGEGARAALPYAVAVFAFGISFGLLARAAGFDAVAAVAMSATTFAGSAQFAAAGVLGAGGTLGAAAAAAILLNARYGPMAAAAAPWFRGPAWRRFLEAQLLVDESWAISARAAGRFDLPALLGSGIVLYAAWVGGTAAGALGAGIIGDPSALGLDAAFPALFLGLLAPRLRATHARMAAALGAGIALALTPFAPPGLPIVASASACLIGLRRQPAPPPEGARAPDPGGTR
ncbi:MAG TPA: AzlC family ABC transporter permease [Actinomycetota bacterium]|nr:AzlC family ABC transporter permease [Actinomycetota bacterium]